MEQRPDPDITMKVYLTKSGYRADVINAEGHRLTVCYEFVESAPVEFWRSKIILGFFDLLKRIRVEK